MFRRANTGTKSSSALQRSSSRAAFRPKRGDKASCHSRVATAGADRAAVPYSGGGCVALRSPAESQAKDAAWPVAAVPPTPRPASLVLPLTSLTPVPASEISTTASPSGHATGQSSAHVQRVTCRLCSPAAPTNSVVLLFDLASPATDIGAARSFARPCSCACDRRLP